MSLCSSVDKSYGFSSVCGSASPDRHEAHLVDEPAQAEGETKRSQLSEESSRVLFRVVLSVCLCLCFVASFDSLRLQSPRH
jgi:hypothetical protein